MATKASEDVLAVAEANNKFILDFHGKLRPTINFDLAVASGTKNFFYSGISISSMLAMMWESFPVTSRSTIIPTAMATKCLQLNPSKVTLVTDGYGEVMRDYEKFTPGPQDAVMNIVNKMYTCSSLGPLKNDFLNKVLGDYRCSHDMISFANQTQAAEKVNDDFSRATNDLVKDPVENGTLEKNAKIVIVSSFYFRGVWEVPFKPEDTKMMDFKKPNGLTVKVPMMIKNKAPGMSYTNFRDMKCHACAMYFEGSRFCMIVVRPKDDNAVLFQTSLEKYMGNDLIPDKLIAHFRRYHSKSRRGEGGLLVNIQMPRFKIQSRHILNKALRSVEGSPFHNTSVLFTNAFEKENGKNACLTQMIQRCSIEINETGAAPDVKQTPLLPPRPAWKARPKCVKMLLNRCFYFVLYDYTNSFIVAAGFVSNPLDN